jgi:hypothetical protein
MGYAQTISERLVFYSKHCAVEGKTSGGKKEHRRKVTWKNSEL